MGRIRECLMEMLQQQSECFADSLVPALAREGIHLRRWETLTPGQQLQARELFDTQISPALTPLVIHSTQPFPFFANGSLSLTFVVRDEKSGEAVDARVKVPQELDQWLPLTADVPPGKWVFVRLHEVIRESRCGSAAMNRWYGSNARRTQTSGCARC